MDDASPAPTGRRRGTRAYRSPRREEQARLTRERILTAARETFVAAGYSATTIRGVACAAEVSVPTVELAFGTKRALFRAVVDRAVADVEPLVLLSTPAADPEAFVDQFAAAIRASAVRAGDLLAVMDEAASVEPEIAAVFRELDEARFATAGRVVQELGCRVPLADADRAADTLWLLMDPMVFRRLTRARGWSADEFELWVGRSIRQLLGVGLSVKT